MAEPQIRKIVVLVEESHYELDRKLAVPARKALAAAVVRNPYAGRYSEKLDLLIEMGAMLGDLLGRRAVAALGVKPEAVQSYGKAAIVGSAGELEHAAAILHPRFGKPFRAAVEKGPAIIPSTVKRAGPGASIDIPLHSKNDEWSFPHFDAISIAVPDAPGPDEVVVVAAISEGGRPLSRISKDS